MHVTRSPDLVGRDTELADLLARLGIDGHRDEPAPRGLLLGGDAGVGKTRLLHELRDASVARGWQVVAGHCLDLAEQGVPYLPFSEILGRLAETRPDVVAATTAQHPVLLRLQPGRRVRHVVDGTKAPVAADGAGEDPSDEPSDEALTRVDLYEAVLVLLEQVAAHTPLLLVVEDAHWADASTRDLLSFLFARVTQGQHPVALVVSYRSDDLHRRHPLRRQVAEWTRARVDRIQLDPLTPDEVRRLVAVLHPEPLDDAQVHDIVRRAEGNAFFVEELVGASSACGCVPGSVPDDLADLLLVRLDGLDAGSERAVRTAAVAGRRVTHALLAAVSGLAPHELEESVRQAVELHVLEPVGADAYRFRHALLAEAVYDDLLPGERIRQHAAYARALASGEVPGTSAELARHALLAHDHDTAYAASVDAGTEAMRVGGPEEAHQHYRQALSLLARPGHEDPEAQVRISVRAADALTSAGHSERANAFLRETLATLPADVAPALRGLLLCHLALGTFVADLDGDELALITESLALLGDAETEDRVRALAAYARILSGHRREEEARSVAAEAITMSERLDLPRLNADVLTTVAALGMRRIDDDLGPAFEQVIDRARRSGAVKAELRGLYGLGRYHQDRGELDEALAAFTTAREHGVRTGLPWAPYAFDALVMGVSVLLTAGRWDEAEAQLRTAGPGVRGSEPGSDSAGATHQQELLVALGLVMDAVRGLPDVEGRARSARGRWSLEPLVAVHGAAACLEVAEQRGDAVAALRCHDDVTAQLARIWSPWFQARLRLAALTLGVVGTAARDASAAARAASEADASRLVADGRRVVAEDAKNVVGPESRAWAVRLEAEHLRWRWNAQVDPPGPDELLDAWRSTLAAFEAYGSVPELVRVRARLVEVLRATGATAEADEVAAVAAEAARGLGAGPVLAELAVRAPNRRTRAGAATSAPGAPGDVPLTPREQEILELVAQGRSNGEIGRQLFIATKTASVHVSNILAKLGAASRTEAAALARARGLVER